MVAEIRNIGNQFYELDHQKEIPNLSGGVAFSRNPISYIA
jgi:hypothetical protein